MKGIPIKAAKCTAMKFKHAEISHSENSVLRVFRGEISSETRLITVSQSYYMKRFDVLITSVILSPFGD